MIVSLKTARAVIWTLVALCIFLCYVTVHQNITLRKWKTIAISAVKNEIELQHDLSLMEQEVQKALDACSGK